MSSRSDVTELLAAWRDGSDDAAAPLMEIVYGELKQLARGYLHREFAAHSVPPTALVHEAYLKLVDQRRVRWQNRAHFFGIAAQAMRRILIDRARARRAGKRAGGAAPEPLVEAAAILEPPDIDLLALDQALSRLERLEPRWSRLVEARFFAGLTVDEAAEVLQLSRATVNRDWHLARGWLFRELQGMGANR